MHRRDRISGCTGILVMALLLAGALGAEEKKSSSANGPRSPEDPSAPSVEVRDRRDSGRATDLPATVVNARGDKRTGSLVVKFGSLEVETMEGGARRKTAVAIADIESIEFTRWRGTERRKHEFTFYPSDMKIILRDKKMLLCTGGAALLNRLAFRSGGESRFIYSYFYDYWKNNAWRNSGQSDRNYPETNPFGDTLVKILFLREEMKNPLEKLLSR